MSELEAQPEVQPLTQQPKLSLDMTSPQPRRIHPMEKNCLKRLSCISVSVVTLLAIGGISLVILFLNNSSHDHSQITVVTIREPVFGEENIMFVETSCTFDTPELESGEGQPLNPRQACALESAALANPQAFVYLLYTCNSSLQLAPAYVQQLHAYSNIYLWHVNFSKIFMDSTWFHMWFQMGILPKSHSLLTDACDVLRFFILWKYGGTYMDLDVVVLRSFRGLSNFAGAQHEKTVGTGLMNFATNGTGREIAEECLDELRTQFGGDVWNNNGPQLLTWVLNRTCDRVQKTNEMTPERCKGFTVYPPATFYPIPWRQWPSYFEEKSYSETMGRLNGSLAIQVWDSLSNKGKINVGSKQPYGLIAQKHCPKVYANCGDVF